MKTKTTLLAALLFAGASQAALAQDHDRGDRGDRPAAQGQGGGGYAAAPAPRGGPPAGPAPHAGPPPGPVAPPPGGYGRLRGPTPPAMAPAGPAAAPGRDGGRSFSDRHIDGDRRDRSGFAPGGTAPGDLHWDRRDAPREVVPPVSGERGWDREHDGHAGDPRHLNRDRGDRHWDGDRRGPPPNWRRWERGQFPPVFSAPRRFHIGPYRPPYGWYVRSWAFGDFLPRGWYGPGYWIDDFYDYDLPWPPPGYHWVRVGPDVLLVDDYTGRIVQVIYDLFW